MEYPVINNTYYYALKKRTKETYFKIGHVWCPALSSSVSFTRVGFRHLTRRGGKLRSQKDQIRRFLLLMRAKMVLMSGDEEVDRRVGRDMSSGEARFWAITKEVNFKTITVVIRQIGSGDKHFFSIYDQKTTQ